MPLETYLVHFRDRQLALAVGTELEDRLAEDGREAVAFVPAGDGLGLTRAAGPRDHGQAACWRRYRDAPQVVALYEEGLLAALESRGLSAYVGIRPGEEPGLARWDGGGGVMLLPAATARDLVGAIARHTPWPLHSARMPKYISVRRGDAGLPGPAAPLALSRKVTAAGIAGPLLLAGFTGAGGTATAAAAFTTAKTRPAAGSAAGGGVVLAQDVPAPEPPSASGMPPLGDDEFRLNYPPTPQYPNGYSRTFRWTTSQYPNPLADPMEVNDRNGTQFQVPPGTTFSNSSGTWQIPPDGSTLYPDWAVPFVNPGIPLVPTNREDIPMSDNSPGATGPNGNSQLAAADDPPPGTQTAETADPQGYTPVAYGGDEQTGGNTSGGSTTNSSSSVASATGSYTSGGGSTSNSYASGGSTTSSNTSGGATSNSYASAGSTTSANTSGGSTSSSSA